MTASGAHVHDPTIGGEWLEWDRIWRRMHQTGDGVVLYTAGTPRTMLEFWQRAYFEDLWILMGGSAERARYLELGSGRGTTSMYLASRNCDVTLVDLSPAALDLAAANFARAGLRAPTMHIEDAANTNLPSGAYDCIYNIGLLEHFDDPTRLLNEALRMLAPGGLLFMVIVPEGSPWRSFPVRAVMNPAGTARRLSAAAARRVAARLGKDPSLGAGSTVAAGAAEMVRTRHDRHRYVEWMNALGAPRARCLPYNPYFSVYSSPALERVLTLPLYRLHLRLVSWMGRAPRLATAGAIASCDLLLFRKP